MAETQHFPPVQAPVESAPPRSGYPNDALRARLRDLGFPGVQHHERVLRRFLSERRRVLPDDASPDDLASAVIELALRGLIRSGPSFSARRGPWRRVHRARD
jgi:hypothetical protein